MDDNGSKNTVKEHYLSVLSKIIKENRNTSYMKDKYNKLFSQEDFNTSELVYTKFKEAVDLTTYESYREYIDQVYNHGNKDVMAPGYPSWFFESGGTTGTPKLFPIYIMKKGEDYPSKRDLNLFSLCDKLKGKIDKNSKCIFLVWKGISKKSPHHNIPVSFGSATIVPPKSDIEPPEVKNIKNHTEHLLLSILFSLMEEDLKYILTVFINIVSDFYSLIETQKDYLIEMLQTSFLNIKCFASLEKNVFESMNYYFKSLVNSKKERAIEVVEILKNTNSHEDFKGIGAKLWPNLCLICANYASNTLRVYLPACKFYTSEAPHYSNTFYGSSETAMGLPLYFKEGYELFKEFFPEFMEYDSEKDATDTSKLYPIWDVKQNKLYEIVITCFNGWLRYRMNDIIEVVDYYKGWPVINYVKRTGWSIDLGFLRIEDSFLYKGITNCGLEITEFVAYQVPGSENRGFCFLTELNKTFYSKKENASENFKINDASKIKEAEKKLNEYFSSVNEHYKKAIDNNKIDKCKINIVVPGTFTKFKLNKAANNNSGSLMQIKIPLVTKDKDMIEFLQSKVIVN